MNVPGPSKRSLTEKTEAETDKIRLETAFMEGNEAKKEKDEQERKQKESEALLRGAKEAGLQISKNQKEFEKKAGNFVKEGIKSFNGMLGALNSVTEFATKKVFGSVIPFLLKGAMGLFSEKARQQSSFERLAKKQESMEKLEAAYDKAQKAKALALSMGSPKLASRFTDTMFMNPWQSLQYGLGGIKRPLALESSLSAVRSSSAVVPFSPLSLEDIKEGSKKIDKNLFQTNMSLFFNRPYDSPTGKFFIALLVGKLSKTLEDKTLKGKQPDFESSGNSFIRTLGKTGSVLGGLVRTAAKVTSGAMFVNDFVKYGLPEFKKGNVLKGALYTGFGGPQSKEKSFKDEIKNVGFQAAKWGLGVGAVTGNPVAGVAAGLLGADITLIKTMKEDPAFRDKAKVAMKMSIKDFKLDLNSHIGKPVENIFEKSIKAFKFDLNKNIGKPLQKGAFDFFDIKSFKSDYSKVKILVENGIQYNIFGKIKTGLIDFFSAIPGQVGSAVSGAYLASITFLSSLPEKISSGIQDTFSKTGAFFSNIGKKIESNPVFVKIKSMFDEAWAAISSPFERLFNFFKDIGKSVGQWLSKTFGIAISPSTSQALSPPSPSAEVNPAMIGSKGGKEGSQVVNHIEATSNFNDLPPMEKFGLAFEF